MDPIDLHQTKLDMLKDQAGRADTRIAELNQELLLHRGGAQHLGQAMGLIDGHRGRLLSQARVKAEEGKPLEGQAEAEHKACIGGILDALTYMRAQVKAAEMSANRTEAALQEMQRHRMDLSAQGKAQANKLDEMADQLARGVPREMVGRPKTAEQVRQHIDAMRAQADKSATTPAKVRRKAAAPA